MSAHDDTRDAADAHDTRDALTDLQIRFADAIRDATHTPLLADALVCADQTAADRAVTHTAPDITARTQADTEARIETRAEADIDANIETPIGAPPQNLIEARLALYRGHVHAHRHAALSNAYPVLRSLVGAPYFERLARAYGAAHPPASGDLHGFGHAMAAFVPTYETDPRFAYFGDIAALEWAVHAAYYAADVTPFSVADWAAVEADLLDARIAIHPACAAIASPYAIARIWTAHQPDGVFPAVIDTRAYVLVVRPAWQPTVLDQSEAAHRAWTALARGQTLNAALDAAFEADATFDFPAQWRIWIESAAVVGRVGAPSDAS
ncbi:putative DNA-binding domain-containing protein [Pararobbsia silviterrae]|nr:putative DNA-binding domain-containing protein [Pararobbsia silviterrae]